MVENNTDEQETVEISTETLATLIHETSITLNQMRQDDTPAPIMEHVKQAFDEANSALDDSVYSTPTRHSPRNAASEADALVEALKEADELAAQMNEDTVNTEQYISIGDDKVDNWEPDYLE